MNESIVSAFWEGFTESFRLARAIVMAPVHVMAAFLSHRPFDQFQSPTPPNRESSKP
jgi:hypothetical protein